MIDPSRLATPRGHQHVLIEPTFPTLIDAISRDWSPSLREAPILDTTIGDLRVQLRRRLGFSRQVVMTGHQAEFSHAGVFAKTVAVHALAQQCNADAAYLIADNDVPKQAELTVPQITETGLTRKHITLPNLDLTLTEESQPPTPREDWLECFTQIASAVEDYANTALKPFVDAWMDCEGDINFVEAITRGRLAIERLAGIEDVRQIRMSELSQTHEFHAFAAHLMLNASAFAEHYNIAQAAYRRRHKIRNKLRPVPPLAIDGNRVELPFWAIAGDGTRRRIFVADIDDAIQLFADDIELSKIAKTQLNSASDQLTPWPFESSGWQLRPRALALSSFCRLFLSDLFVHGIGGAKYDEVTDDFVQHFFGTAPPAICCVSATSYLPLPCFGVTQEQIRAAERNIRDLRFNPQRHIAALSPETKDARETLSRRAMTMKGTGPRYHTIRETIWKEINQLNADMVESTPSAMIDYQKQLATLRSRYVTDTISRDREYFVGLHLVHTLNELAAKIRRRIIKG